MAKQPEINWQHEFSRLQAQGNVHSIALFIREQIAEYHKLLHEQLIAKLPIRKLVKDISSYTDTILIAVWEYFQLHNTSDICLIALGGYGRRELQPHSDVDILILIPTTISNQNKTKIENFLQCLWDSGLEVGQSIRTESQCIVDADEDISFFSNLLEMRLLTGEQKYYTQLQQALIAQRLWPENKFFQGKWKEQQLRYKRYGESAYNLEPNIKNSPGSLRDLQMIRWVTKRTFKTDTLEGLLEHKFLSQAEYDTLIHAQAFLWRIRCAMHLITGRLEDRLLFDHQATIAKQFGYKGNDKKQLIEAFMKDYYRVIKTLRELNDMLLQLFREAILTKGAPIIVALNERFQINNRYIEVVHDEVFAETPSALLEVFVLTAANPEIKGVRATTIRLIRQHIYLIDNEFRANQQHRQLFIALLRQDKRITAQLQRMNRYGVLGAYLPAFEQIIGQMQHDLFHTYTVDQHTLFVIRNIRRFSKPDFKDEFPLCYELVPQFKDPEILYIAALFHDIAKGRGGDHSELGAIDAKEFCLAHNLKTEQTELIAWLVQQHLLMSITAQRQDIYDPQTIKTFLQEVKSQRRLDSLYILTVADMSATNPRLWNNWKSALLKELYRLSKRQLQQETILDEPQIARRKQHKARKILTKLQQNQQQQYDIAEIDALWQDLPRGYFLFEPSETIVSQSAALLSRKDATAPTLVITPNHAAGGSEIFIYAPFNENRYSISTTVIANHQLTIVEARMLKTKQNYSLETYIVLTGQQAPIRDYKAISNLKHDLLHYHNAANDIPVLIPRRISRQQHHFQTPTQVSFQQDKIRQRTMMFVTASDRPGLLAQLAHALQTCEVNLHNAKISTVGDRVEDMFYITNNNGQLITELAEQDNIRQLVAKIS